MLCMYEAKKRAGVTGKVIGLGSSEGSCERMRQMGFADAIIRMMDQAHARGWRVAQAIEAKMKFNATRAHKHGKEF